MPCLITDGVGITCDDLRKVGGVNKRFYMYNFDEFISAGFDADGYVDLLNFTAYDGLHNFIGRKQGHSGGITGQIQAPGGNKFYQHNVIAKLFPNTPAEDAVMEDVLVGCFGIILEDNNDEFFLYGLDNGMSLSEEEQNTGAEQASDVGDLITFFGSEKLRPKRILVQGSSLATKNYLDTLVV